MLRPTPKLEDHPLSAVRDCLFNLIAGTLHIGGRSSIRNLRTRHAVVTGTHKPGRVPSTQGKPGSQRTSSVCLNKAAVIHLQFQVFINCTTITYCASAD